MRRQTAPFPWPDGAWYELAFQAAYIIAHALALTLAVTLHGAALVHHTFLLVRVWQRRD